MPAKSAPEIWKAALDILELQVSSVAFETWFRGTTGHEREGHSFTVGVPTAFVADWLDKRMRSLIERTLSDLLQRPTELRFALGEDSPRPAEAVPEEPRATLPDLPPAEHVGAARRGSGTRHSAASARRDALQPNPEMTFETLVPVSANQFAYAAAETVADDPGGTYNPLFVSGPPGLGKTHLLNAVANRARPRPAQTILATAEQFVSEFVWSAREKKANQFERHYRSAQMLIIDDVQFLCGKQRSEESFFNTCAALLSKSRQVVLSADQPLDRLPFAHRKLAGRFAAGLEVTLTAPPPDSREAILAFKASRAPAPVPEEVIRFIAARPSPSIRHLEGELARVIAMSTLMGEPLTLELAIRALTSAGREASAPKNSHAPSSLIHATASFFQVPLAALTGPTRERTTVHARHVAMYLLRRETDLSLQQIGRMLGNRDHTTVRHGVDKINRLSTVDASLHDDFASITSAAPDYFTA